MPGRSKSKNNPGGKCNLCKIKIFNRQRNTKYCEEDYKIVVWIRTRLGNLKTDHKQRHPKYKLTIRWRLEKK